MAGINVSRNACKGILNARGTCGPCEIEEIAIENVPKSKTDKKEKSKGKGIIGSVVSLFANV